jgi:hypothetical protein
VDNIRVCEEKEGEEVGERKKLAAFHTNGGDPSNYSELFATM